jgi:pimeloyl-ACP methyl ester carboxylesterase
MVNGKVSANGAAGAEKKELSSLTLKLWRLFEIAYGWLVLLVFTFQMFRIDKRFRKMSDTDKKELKDARDRLWNLEKQPYGLTHKFCELREGTRLHYVVSKPDKIESGKTALVIFIHGFPDSCYVWSPVLKRMNLRENATLLAVDLPGYGGSDGLAKYDATPVLETMTEFILKMREQYAAPDASGKIGPVVIVSHDWGSIVAFRLASEAPNLADRFIISNCFHPSLLRANIENHVQSAALMFKTWMHNPIKYGLLGKALTVFRPVLKQLSKSGYVFTFKLPWPFGAILGQYGDFWFFRLLNAFAWSNRPKEPLSGTAGWDMLASSLGPSSLELQSSTGTSSSEKDDIPSTYPNAVKFRTRSGGWSTKIRYYQDGLLFDHWTKSLQILWELNQIEESASSFSSPTSNGSGARRKSVGVFDIGPPGTLGAATTIIWGNKDIACDKRIAMEGIGDYFGVGDSHFIELANVGHWTTCDRQAVDVWERVIHWAATGEQERMKSLLQAYPVAKMTISS